MSFVIFHSLTSRHRSLDRFRIADLPHSERTLYRGSPEEKKSDVQVFPVPHAAPVIIFLT